MAHRLLRNQGDLASIPLQVQLFDVVSVQRDGTRDGIIKPLQHLDRGAFAASRRTDQCDKASGLDGQVQFLQDSHMWARWISKVDVVKHESTPCRLVGNASGTRCLCFFIARNLGLGVAFDIWLIIDQLEDGSSGSFGSRSIGDKAKHVRCFIGGKDLHVSQDLAGRRSTYYSDKDHKELRGIVSTAEQPLRSDVEYQGHDRIKQTLADGVQRLRVYSRFATSQ